MRTMMLVALLAALTGACRPADHAADGDTVQLPDTTAIQGAGHVPHPLPSAMDTLAPAAPDDTVQQPPR